MVRSIDGAFRYEKPFRGARKGCRDGRMVVVRSDYGVAQVQGKRELCGRANAYAKAAVRVRSIRSASFALAIRCSSREAAGTSSRTSHVGLLQLADKRRLRYHRMAYAFKRPRVLGFGASPSLSLLVPFGGSREERW